MEETNRDIVGIRGEVEKIASVVCPWKEKGMNNTGSEKEAFISGSEEKGGKKVKMKCFINLLVFLLDCSVEPSYCD